MQTYYTYLHCKPNGDPFYVGKGKHKRSHNFSQRNSYHKKIVAKYGQENIKVFIFSCESEEQAFTDEIQQIAQLKRDGYQLTNCTTGGEGVAGAIQSDNKRLKVSLARTGTKLSPETIEKVKRSLIGNKRNLGNKASTETKLKMSIARKGMKQSKEFSKKLTNRMMGNQYWVGKKHTDATIKKSSDTRKEFWANPDNRKKMMDAMATRKSRN
jgi:hypothetical protein